jgi:signal peptidase I
MTKRSKDSDLKRYWRATVDFLKDDSSALSWIANLIIAFIVIKFILYPLLGFLFGAGLPVVAVVSSSMDHDAIDGSICGIAVIEYTDDFDTYWNTCGGWYEQRGITKEQFSEYPFRGGFNKGDIMVILGPKRSEPELGDVLVFEAQQQYPIIHRIVAITNTSAGPVYATKGDHNPAQIAEYIVANDYVASRCEYQGEPSPCDGIGKPVTSKTPGAFALIDETTIPHEAVIGKAVLRVPWLGWVKIWFTDLLQWAIGLFH